MQGEKRSVLDAWAQSFVANLKPKGRFRPIALKVVETHRNSGDTLVLLSASPDLYVPLIGQMLGFERTLCTEIEWRGERLDGALKTPNRRGAEKLHCLHWLRRHYPGMPIIAYGNASSDIEHLRQADRALLVNGSRPRSRTIASAIRRANRSSPWARRTRASSAAE